MKLLFVCSRNQWRSPTAEAVFRRDAGLEVRSVGTSPRARRTASALDIRWADVVVVMEVKHRSRLQARFDRLLHDKPLHVLHIPDEYRFMDPELVEVLRASVDPIVADWFGTDETV